MFWMKNLTIDIKFTGKNIPEYKTIGSSGMDLCSAENIVLKPNEFKIVKSGVHISMPEGVECQVRGRSGLASKGIIAHFGTVDSDYRGDVGVILYNFSGQDFEIKEGDRIAQLVFSYIIKVDLNLKDELDDTVRGQCGFGSTGI